MKQPYKFWTKPELKEQLFRQIINYNLPYSVELMVKEALNDNCWNPIYDFDGCTLVQDIDHPCISCFIHDYHWISGRGGYVSNKIFYRLMLITGFKKYEAARRLLGVTIAWYAYYKWHHALKRNINPYGNGMKLFINKKGLATQ